MDVFRGELRRNAPSKQNSSARASDEIPQSQRNFRRLLSRTYGEYFFTERREPFDAIRFKRGKFLTVTSLIVDDMENKWTDVHILFMATEEG